MIFEHQILPSHKVYISRGTKHIRSRVSPKRVYSTETHIPTRNRWDEATAIPRAHSSHNSQSKLRKDAAGSVFKPSLLGGIDPATKDNHQATLQTPRATNPWVPSENTITLEVWEESIDADLGENLKILGTWTPRRIIIFRLPPEKLLEIQSSSPSQTRRATERLNGLGIEVEEGLYGDRFIGQPSLGPTSTVLSASGPMKRRKVSEGIDSQRPFNPFPLSKGSLAIPAVETTRQVDDANIVGSSLKRKIGTEDINSSALTEPKLIKKRKAIKSVSSFIPRYSDGLGNYNRDSESIRRSVAETTFANPENTRTWKCSKLDCRYYEEGFHTEKARDEHFKDFHPLVLKVYKCKYPPCTHEFTTEKRCKEHMKTVHEKSNVPKKQKTSGFAEVNALASNLTANLFLGGRRYSWEDTNATSESSGPPVRPNHPTTIPSTARIQISGFLSTPLRMPAVPAVPPPSEFKAAKEAPSSQRSSFSLESERPISMVGGDPNSHINTPPRPIQMLRPSNSSRRMNPVTLKRAYGSTDPQSSHLIKSQLGPDRLQAAKNFPQEHRPQITPKTAPISLFPSDDTALAIGGAESSVPKLSLIVKLKLPSMKQQTSAKHAIPKHRHATSMSTPSRELNRPKRPPPPSSRGSSSDPLSIFTILDYARKETERPG
jgi:hypothetical protein